MSTLIAWVWQGIAMAILVDLALRVASRRVSATTRHAIWWAALVGVLALPLMSIASTGPIDWSIVTGTLGPDAPDRSPWLEVSAPPEWMGAAALGAWLGVVLLGTRRMVRGLLHVKELKTWAIPVSPALEARLPLWRAARTQARPVLLCTSDRVAIPCALGLWRAMVVLPAGLVDGLSDKELDTIVVHEYAHLVRRDDWGRLIQAVIDVVAGIHPAVRWISSRIELEREAAADDRVVACTGSRQEYAQVLARIAAMAVVDQRSSPATFAVAPGAFRRVSGLRTRVARLLDPRRARRESPGPTRRLAAYATMCVAVVGLARFEHLVVVGDRRPITLAGDAGGLGADGWPAGAGGALQDAVTRAELSSRTASAPLPRDARSDEGLTAASNTVRRSRNDAAADAFGNALRSTTEVPRALTPVMAPRSDAPTEATPAPITASTHALSAVAVVPPLPAPSVGLLDATMDGDPEAWSVAADAGVALGAQAKRAGLAVGRFFTPRGGRAASVNSTPGS